MPWSPLTVPPSTNVCDGGTGRVSSRIVTTVVLFPSVAQPVGSLRVTVNVLSPSAAGL